MLKQLVEDVRFEACRGSYLEKIGRLGHKDAELALLGYHLITVEKIRAFLLKNAIKIIGRGDFKFNASGLLENWSEAAEKWANGSVGIWVRVSEYDTRWLVLREVHVENYPKFIPETCVDRALQAKESGLFDYLTVAYPETQSAPVSDPVIFGRRKESQNRFYVAQWDNDVTLDDLI